MVSERSLAVLHAIVSDFVGDGEPVGSKAIVDGYSFGVSAATIRNDMALLEDEELIIAPHTSSGRIPTDKGYRLYVDTLAKIRPLTSAQRNAIERFLGEAQDLDDTMARTVRLLASLTNQLAVVQYPALRKTVVRHIEFVMVAADRMLCVLITGAGVVEQQIVRLPYADVSETWIGSLRERVAEAIIGVDIDRANEHVQTLIESIDEWALPAEQEIMLSVLDALQTELSANRSQRITISGAANLTRPGEFTTSLPTMLEAIEEQVTLLRLFQELATDPRGVGSSIGRENIAYGLADAAVIATQYEASGDSISRLGVLGPTRMDYAGNIAAVRAVARYLSQLLGEPGA